MKIHPSHLQQIHNHLERGYPNEACGIMLGRHQTVEEIVTADNTRSDSAQNRYLIDPLVYMKIEREADRRGIEVLGIYHSHPDCPARPSQFDLDHAWPNLSYLIVSVVKGKVAETRSWRMRDDRSRFDEENVEISNETVTLTR